MGYYLFTGKRYFGKTHLVVGYGEFFHAACGLKWKRDTTALKQMKKERIRPVGRTMTGSTWPGLKDIGVTCVHCLQNGYPPVLRRMRSASPPQLPPEQQEEKSHRPEDVHRGQRGGLDVGLFE